MLNIKQTVITYICVYSISVGISLTTVRMKDKISHIIFQQAKVLDDRSIIFLLSGTFCLHSPVQVLAMNLH